MKEPVFPGEVYLKHTHVIISFLNVYMDSYLLPPSARFVCLLKAENCGPPLS